ncbi:MAG TPA: hypothetical protein VEB20_12030 [Azospirillaceae bacterium]|nr:hypothetical protein [Azospirillaceae bacterium]
MAKRSLVRKLALWVGVPVAAVLLLLGALAGGFVWLFEYAGPTPDYPKPRDAREAQLQDLDFLSRFPDYDRSFTAEGRAAFARVLEELKAKDGTLTPVELEMGVARAVTTAGNAHTTTGTLGRANRLNRLPLRFGWFGDELRVVRARAEQAALLGARVTALEGRDPLATLETLSLYRAGPPSHVKATAPVMLESPELLHAVGLSDAKDALDLELELADGTRTALAVAALPPDPAYPRVWPWRMIAPQPLPGEPEGWRTVLPADAPLPLYLRDVDRPFLVEVLEEPKALYFRLHAYEDAEGETLAAAQARALAALRARGLRHAVLDFRFNGGGDYTRMMGFVRELAEALPADGRLVVVTGNETFSAAIVNTAMAKYYGGARSRIVGEPVGDHLVMWAEGDALTLPNSGIAAYFSTGKHDWEKGCRDPYVCYWMNLLWDVPAGSVAPDVPAHVDFPAYLQGRDPVLDRALAVLAGG